MIRRSTIPGSTQQYIINNKGVDHWDRYGLDDEGPLIEWCQQFAAPDRDFLDIGANVGIYTMELAARFKQVHAFEPQRMVYYQLCGALALNQHNNVIAHNVALGTHEESGQRRDMTVMSPDCSGSSLDKTKIRNEQQTQPDNVLGTETVTLACVDDFNFDNVGFIKLDVEGYELEVLKGAVKTLKKCNYPRILFEAWHQEFNKLRRAELFDFLRGLGYRIIPINGYPHMFLAEH